MVSFLPSLRCTNCLVNRRLYLPSFLSLRVAAIVLASTQLIEVEVESAKNVPLAGRGEAVWYGVAWRQVK